MKTDRTRFANQIPLTRGEHYPAEDLPNPDGVQGIFDLDLDNLSVATSRDPGMVTVAANCSNGLASSYEFDVTAHGARRLARLLDEPPTWSIERKGSRWSYRTGTEEVTPGREESWVGSDGSAAPGSA